VSALALRGARLYITKHLHKGADEPSHEERLWGRACSLPHHTVSPGGKHRQKEGLRGFGSTASQMPDDRQTLLAALGVS
jgi:hypothetical protein